MHGWNHSRKAALEDRRRIKPMFKNFRHWLCRLICKDKLFNSDMSLEIDYLVKENDELRERLDVR